MHPSHCYRLLPLAGLLLAACSAAPAATPAWTVAPQVPGSPVTASSQAVSRPVDAALVVEVYKSPSCSCCHEWEAYMQNAGFEVRSIPTDDTASVKAKHGIPQDAWSCHTAVIDGYAIEGHVPVEAIRDLLDQRPEIDGIALPGMPPGSPGMPGEKVGPFEILAVTNGVTSTFGSY